MSGVLAIALAEWRQWRRSRLAISAGLLLAVLLLTSCWVTVARMEAEREVRLQQQHAAEHAFTSQPARHPHRMVHYGHYVFRLPSPLAALEPGVDPITGQSIFLEGHRQNSATGSEARRSAFLGDLSLATPAFLYQFFAPLLLVLLGYATVVREREARTLLALLAQGTTAGQILAGKGLALVAAALCLQLPAILIGLRAWSLGEPPASLVALQAAYFLYLVVWSVCIVLASTLARTRGTALTTLLAVWLGTTLVVPGAAVNSVAAALPPESKIASDLAMQQELRELGDGHDASDPAFAAFRSRVLAQYEVDSVEDLPVNWRGVVAEHSEAELTEMMNRYAEQRMDLEVKQADAIRQFGWLSPYLAIGAASRSLAGADLATHHRFLREAEQLRFDFVQGLNRAHAEQLTYQDDINRSRDAASERRTRISPENWRVLEEFEFRPAAASTRIRRAAPSIAMLALWLIAGLVAASLSARRLGA